MANDFEPSAFVVAQGRLLKYAVAIVVPLAVTTLVLADTSPLDSPFNQPVVLRMRRGAEPRGVVYLIARTANLPFGFEGRSEPVVVANADDRLVNVSTSTPREALNALVELSPDFNWMDMNGVIVVRPASAALDAHDVLNRPVPELSWNNLTPSEAMDRFSQLVYPGIHLRISEPSAGAGFSLHIAAGSLLDALNAAARAHGELMWSADYHGDEQDTRTKFRLLFLTYNGSVVGRRWPSPPIQRQ